MIYIPLMWTKEEIITVEILNIWQKATEIGESKNEREGFSLGIIQTI